MGWAQRVPGGDEQPSAEMIRILRYMVNNSDAPRSMPPGGGKLSAKGDNVTLYTGGGEVTFDRLAQTLSALLGASVDNVTTTMPSGETEARRLSFPADVSIVYMTFRDNGISINIPKKSLPLVSEKLADYEKGLEGSASDIAKI